MTVPASKPAETSEPVPTQIPPTEVVTQAEPEFADPISSVLRDLNPTGPKPVIRSQFLQLLPRDAIKPVYVPTYLSAHTVALDPEDLVIGVSIAGEHRAYPIRTLQFSEMVNDELGGVPILATW